MTRSYIAFDGEGETRHTPSCDHAYQCECPHYYCLLAWSLGPNKPHGYIFNADGLSTHEAIDYVWEVISEMGCTPVMFSASYDFNCLMRDLDRRRAQWLWDEQPVRVGKFEVEYNKRILTIHKERKRIEVSDVWRFYQGSFVAALEKNLPDYDGLNEIREQKQRRSAFSFAADFDSILHYCLKELDALVLLMEKLDADLDAAGIGKTRLNGAGSIAAKLMQLHHVKRHQVRPKDEDYRDIWPEVIEQAAYYAYSGGRIEPWKFGQHSTTLHVYDLRSAYPRAMCDLPSLVGGRWQRTCTLGQDSSAFAVYRVRFNASKRERGYPFFQRLDGGSILYPQSVEGWYWSPEIHAAKTCGFEFDLIDGYTFHRATDERPFAFVSELFARRAALKASGQLGAQEVIKLGLNSLYGKLAQTVGGDAANPPPFHQIGWAGYVTARTRAEVFKAAMQKPDATVFIATDGVASLEPLDLPLGTGLGEWEYTQYNSALVIQAGVYFLWDGDKCIPKYRGFDRNAIEPAQIIDAWRNGLDKLDVPSTRFVTLGSALEAHWSNWCSWRTIPRELDLTGGDGKREFTYPNGHRPWRELCDLWPVSHEGITYSEAYQPKWRELEKDKLDSVPLSMYEDELEVTG